MKIKKGDTVKILSGKDRGKSGVIERVLPKTAQVVVAGMNIVKKHRRAKTRGTSGGITAVPAPLGASRVQVVCPHCQKPTRIKMLVTAEGKRSRSCMHCHEALLGKES